MAKKEKAPPPAPKKEKGKAGKDRGKGGAGKIVFALMLFLVPIWPTACLLVPGMMPTLVALVTDRDREKALALTIGATNLAGCLPFILQLWSMGQTFDNAMRLMRDPLTWLIMLASAGVGYVIYTVVPGIVAGIMAGSAAGKIDRLRQNLEELKRVWGPDVATEKKLDTLGDLEN